MSTKTTKEAAEAAAPVVKTAKASVYTADELIANHKVFKASKAIVKVALKQAKKDSATFAEAKDIIEKFRNKEVK